jgi:hypothetical protein
LPIFVDHSWPAMRDLRAVSTSLHSTAG